MGKIDAPSSATFLTPGEALVISLHILYLYECVAMTRGEKWAAPGNPLGWVARDHFASNLTV